MGAPCNSARQPLPLPSDASELRINPADGGWYPRPLPQKKVNLWQADARTECFHLVETHSKDELAIRSAACPKRCQTRSDALVDKISVSRNGKRFPEITGKSSRNRSIPTGLFPPRQSNQLLGEITSRPAVGTGSAKVWCGADQTLPRRAERAKAGGRPAILSPFFPHLFS